MSNVSNDMGISPLGFKAGGTVAIHRLVVLDSTAGQCVATSAITNVALGASLNAASSGDNVAVQQHGVALLRLGAGGATLGAQLMPEASGEGDAVIAAGATAVSVGIALKAGDEGETIPVLLCCPNLRAPANS